MIKVTLETNGVAAENSTVIMEDTEDEHCDRLHMSVGDAARVYNELKSLFEDRRFVCEKCGGEPLRGGTNFSKCDWASSRGEWCEGRIIVRRK